MKAPGKKENKSGNKLSNSRDIEQIITSLELHKVEPEMQNDQLLLASDELERSRKKFETLYDLAPVSYFTLNSSGFILECNNAALELLKFTRGKVVGAKLQKFICTDNIRAYQQFIETIKTTGSRSISDIKLKLGASKEMFCRLYGIGIYNADEDMTHAQISAIDITSTIRNKQDLEESKWRLDTALSASGTGTWYIDLESGKIFWDEYKKLLYGLKKEFDGKYDSFLSLIHPEDRNSVDAALRTTISEEKDLNIQYRVIWPDGEIKYLTAKGKIIYDERQTPIRLTGIAFDITQQKLLEQETLKRTIDKQKELLQAILKAQEEERTRIGEAVHNGLAQLLYATKLKINALGESDSNDKTLRNAITNILEIAIKETRNISFQLFPSILKDFGLKAALEEVVKRISTPLFNVILETEGIEKRLQEEIETGIFRIIQELLNNAMKHAKASKVLVSLQREGNYIHLEVKDNGKGFDVNSLTSHEGSGISSIRNRLELMNGSLEMHSEKGKGTSFDIKINLIKDLEK